MEEYKNYVRKRTIKFQKYIEKFYLRKLASNCYQTNVILYKFRTNNEITDNISKMKNYIENYVPQKITKADNTDEIRNSRKINSTTYCLYGKDGMDIYKII